jgi:hypothetical protein
MRITSGGLIGINTNSPFNFGSGSGMVDVRSQNVDAVSGVFVSNSNATARLTMYINNAATAIIGTSTNHALAFATQDTEKMRITSGGNVSIGNTNNTYKLDVSGQVKSTQYLIAPDGANNVYNFIDATDTYTGAYSLQAGGGSAGYGGSLVMFGHSHATKPGYVVAGISVGSGGKFTVNDQANGGGTEVFTVNAVGAATFASNVTANGFKSYSGTSSIASGASSIIHTMSANGLYTVQVIITAGSLIYSAAAIFYAHYSNAQYIKVLDLYDGNNVTLDNSGSGIRITNDGFATFTWAWSITFQPF